MCQDPKRLSRSCLLLLLCYKYDIDNVLWGPRRKLLASLHSSIPAYLASKDNLFSQRTTTRCKSKGRSASAKLIKGKDNFQKDVKLNIRRLGIGINQWKTSWWNGLLDIIVPLDGRHTISSWKQRGWEFSDRRQQQRAQQQSSLCNVVLNEITLPSLSREAQQQLQTGTIFAMCTLGSSCIDYSMRQWQQKQRMQYQRIPLEKRTHFTLELKIWSFVFFLKAKKEGLWYIIMKVYVRNRMAFLRAPAQTPTCLGCA